MPTPASTSGCKGAASSSSFSLEAAAALVVAVFAGVVFVAVLVVPANESFGALGGEFTDPADGDDNHCHESPIIPQDEPSGASSYAAISFNTPPVGLSNRTCPSVLES